MGDVGLIGDRPGLPEVIFFGFFTNTADGNHGCTLFQLHISPASSEDRSPHRRCDAGADSWGGDEKNFSILSASIDRMAPLLLGGGVRLLLDEGGISVPSSRPLVFCLLYNQLPCQSWKKIYNLPKLHDKNKFIRRKCPVVGWQTVYFLPNSKRAI
jgi:hypothetical protein